MKAPKNPGSPEPALTRRSFLGRGTGRVAALAASPLAGRPAPARRAKKPPVFVHVFLRGGMDGLTAVVPYGDEDLYKGRPDLAIAPPGKPNGAIDVDGFFGLAPACAPLLTPLKNGHLSIFHAAGTTDPTRSHFNAFKKVEFGVPGQPITTSTGWIARHLMEVAPPKGGGTLRAVAIEPYMPQALALAPASMPIPEPDKLFFPGDDATGAARRAVIAEMYGAAPAPTGVAGLRTLDTIDLMSGIDFAGYEPAKGASYPDTGLGRKLRHAATLIKADIGIEVIMADRGDWDLHGEMGPLDGKLAMLLDDLTRSLEAFYLDTLEQIDDVVVVVMSEFGRRVKENASGGTDHGHGNAMFVLGSGFTTGGKVTARWPTLAPDKLTQGDLQTTIDYRDLVGEILVKRCGNESLDVVFPNHEPAFLDIVS